jgi:2-dehydro-3-deoxyphosphogluconate aldolase/(4S)-4-hydroxy-2-oxoglutarate aldolase
VTQAAAGLDDLAARLRRARIVPVIRDGDTARAQALVARLLEAGLDTIELTTSIPGWQDVAAALSEAAPDVAIGIGTVLSADLAREAVQVQPEFCVSPCLVPEARAVLEDAGIPLIEGGLTPTEVLAAASRGIAKLFPADIGGVGYLRSLLAVAPAARIVPTGGIPLEEAGAWLRAGALAVGVGSDLGAPGDIGARVRRAVAP